MILDFGGGFFLRQATADDHDALARICLKTGNAGKDATDREDDPGLLGLIFAIPYQVFEPELAFVIGGPAGASGYLFGVRDTAAFNGRLKAEWYPQLRQRVADPGPDRASWRGSDWARHWIHHPELDVFQALAPYPSHGHIDLLSGARGKGIGRQAMAFLEQRLIASSSPGLFLQVDPCNQGAIRFYEAIGFKTLADEELPKQSIYVAKRLGAA